ncbi:MAG: hypothetical protein WCO00_09575 [Rhodospirillaceae bacterium]
MVKCRKFAALFNDKHYIINYKYDLVKVLEHVFSDISASGEHFLEEKSFNDFLDYDERFKHNAINGNSVYQELLKLGSIAPSLIYHNIREKIKKDKGEITFILDLDNNGYIAAVPYYGDIDKSIDQYYQVMGI